MTFTIRRARHDDAAGIIEAHIRSIREICSQDYTPEQVNAWAGRKFREVLWQQAIDRDLVWVVEHEEKVRGFGHLALMSKEKGEVMGLYLTPEVKGLGAGKEMFRVIREEAIKNGLCELELHATLTAKTFYEHCGFHQYASDTTVEMQGVPIPCHPMKCQLS